MKLTAPAGTYRQYLSHFNACLALADTPVPQDAVATAYPAEAGVTRTRPPPLAAPGGTGGGHRAGGRTESAAGAVWCRWRRRSGRRLQHQQLRGDWARGEGLLWALRCPLPRWAQQRPIVLATAGTAAVEASPGATGAACLAASASTGVGGAAEAEGTGG